MLNLDIVSILVRLKNNAYLQYGPIFSPLFGMNSIDLGGRRFLPPIGVLANTIVVISALGTCSYLLPPSQNHHGGSPFAHLLLGKAHALKCVI